MCKEDMEVLNAAALPSTDETNVTTAAIAAANAAVSQSVRILSDTSVEVAVEESVDAEEVNDDDEIQSNNMAMDTDSDATEDLNLSDSSL